jgi:hypothetical protein
VCQGVLADGSVQLGGTVLNFFFLDPLFGAEPHLTSMAIGKHSLPVSARLEGWEGGGCLPYDGVIVDKRTAESFSIVVSPWLRGVRSAA